MRDPELEKKRLAMIVETQETAWKFGMAQPGPVEDLVLVLAAETDANAAVLLRALGMEAEPDRSGSDGAVPASFVAVPRADAVRRLEPRVQSWRGA